MTIIEHDGVARQTSNGPKSPWPDWVPLPQGAKLTVRAWYADAPGHPGIGFGDLKLARTPEADIAALKHRLAAEGWTVTTSLLRTSSPKLPPRLLVMCSVRGVREGPDRTVDFAFQLQPQIETRVFWTNGPPPPTWGQQPGPGC